jgi:hypothetical protein
MRGRPTCLLLRQFAPLFAVVALLGPTAAFAAGPAPDRAPAAASGLRPDPAPGARPQAHPAAPVATTTRRPVYLAPAAAVVAPVARHAAPARTVEKRPVASKPKPKPKRRVVHPAATFTLPRVALPALAAASAVRAPRDLDAALAVVALLLAAVTAGSGARLVSRWNSRAGAA